MSRIPKFDAIDRKLLTLLQRNRALSLTDLGDSVGLSPSAVQRRLKAYGASGVIAKEIAVLNSEAIPGLLLACVLVTLDRESKKLHAAFQERMRTAPEVQQCYDVSGEWDYVVILASNGMPHCRMLIEDLFLEAPNIKRYTTLFVYNVVKAGLEIPIASPRERRVGRPAAQ